MVSQDQYQITVGSIFPNQTLMLHMTFCADRVKTECNELLGTTVKSCTKMHIKSECNTTIKLIFSYGVTSFKKGKQKIIN